MDRTASTNSSPRVPPQSSTPDGDAQRFKQEKDSVAVSAVVVALGIMASRILGLLRDMMTARYFSNDVRDAFFNAFRLPNLFRRILGEGSLSVSFIPIFIEILSLKATNGSKTEAEARAKWLVSGIFSILMSITITLSLLAIIFMEDVMHVLLTGEAYLSVPGKFEITVRLGRIMFPPKPQNPILYGESGWKIY